MENGVYLFAAFSITWSILFIYVFRIFLDQKTLTAKIAALQKTLQPKEDL